MRVPSIILLLSIATRARRLVPAVLEEADSIDALITQGTENISRIFEIMEQNHLVKKGGGCGKGPAWMCRYKMP